jgi:TorA maturation chaperone TorD
MIDTESPVASARARAAAYRAFALAFQPPTEAGLREIGGVDDPMALPSLAAEYWRVFGHTGRGLVCPCETEYGDDNKYQQPQQLADISGYYLAFGLTPIAATGLRQDHVACECEFMMFLNLKQAFFLEQAAAIPDGDETLAITCRAERTFLRDHLGWFGRAFGSSLASAAGGEYYRAWGAQLVEWLDLECARLGVAPGPLALALRPDLADDAPMACGSSGDLIQIQRR